LKLSAITSTALDKRSNTTNKSWLAIKAMGQSSSFALVAVFRLNRVLSVGCLVGINACLADGLADSAPSFLVQTKYLLNTLVCYDDILAAASVRNDVLTCNLHTATDDVTVRRIGQIYFTVAS
jgi:hypothetical protein